MTEITLVPGTITRRLAEDSKGSSREIVRIRTHVKKERRFLIP